MALVFPGGMGSGNYWNVLLGIVFFVVGVQVLAILAKHDPLISSIFRRTVRYQDRYIASSRVLRQDRKY